MITTVTQKNMVTIPVQVARRFGIKPGWKLDWQPVEGKDEILVRVIPRREELARRLLGPVDGFPRNATAGRVGRRARGGGLIYLLDTSALLAHHRQESGWEQVQAIFTDDGAEILIYRRARSKAAATETSLSRVVQDFLARWANAEQSRAELVARLDALFIFRNQLGAGAGRCQLPWPAPVPRAA